MGAAQHAPPAARRTRELSRERYFLVLLGLARWPWDRECSRWAEILTCCVSHLNFDKWTTHRSPVLSSPFFSSSRPPGWATLLRNGGTRCNLYVCLRARGRPVTCGPLPEPPERLLLQDKPSQGAYRLRRRCPIPSPVAPRLRCRRPRLGAGAGRLPPGPRLPPRPSSWAPVEYTRPNQAAAGSSTHAREGGSCAPAASCAWKIFHCVRTSVARVGSRATFKPGAAPPHDGHRVCAVGRTFKLCARRICEHHGSQRLSRRALWLQLVPACVCCRRPQHEGRGVHGKTQCSR